MKESTYSVRLLLSLLLACFIIYLQLLDRIGLPIRSSSPGLASLLYRADKLITIFLFFFAIAFRILSTLVRKEENCLASQIIIKKNEVLLSLSLFFFALWSLISAAVNSVPLVVTVHALEEYLIYYIIFFVFVSLSSRKISMKFVYKCFLIFALLVGSWAIIQELCYLLYHESIYWWYNIVDPAFVVRNGLYRTPSFLGHPNGAALFLLFCLTIELNRRRKRMIVLIFLIISLLLCQSRAAILGFIIAAFASLSSLTKKILIIITVTVILAVSLITVASLNLPYIKLDLSPSASKSTAYDNYRFFTMGKSIEIFLDQPVFGVGPGRYGGYTSVKYDSPIYSKYGFPRPMREYLSYVGTIEQQLFQVISELGIPGIFLYILLLMTPFLLIRKLSSPLFFSDDFLYSMRNGLKIISFQMVIYSLWYNVTGQQIWLIPYLAFSGMLICRISEQKNESTTQNMQLSSVLF